MATVEHTTQGPTYGNSTVRTMESDSTTASSEEENDGSWVGGRKRDWDNAFMSKFYDFETTLRENDNWLTLYWENITGMKDTKKPDMAIAAALKTSSTKRRSRSRIDIRDVFAGSMREGTERNWTPRLSPIASRFNTGSSRGLRIAKRRSSHYGGNTLNMTMAQMAMIPPKSPYLTNVNSQGQSPAPPPQTKKQQSNLSLKSQRSREGNQLLRTRSAAVVEQSTLSRSNSAAAKTAEAVKRLQAIAGSPPKQQNMVLEPEHTTGSEKTQTQLATPPISANVPLSTTENKTPVTSPQRLTAPAARFTPVAPMPTLRDMLLNHHSPPKPTQPVPTVRSVSGEVSQALGSLSLDAKQKQQQTQQTHYRQQQSSQSSQQSSPEPLRKYSQTRSRSASSNEGEQELTNSEEDVRERLQRVWIALGKPSATQMSSIAEQPEASVVDEEAEKIREEARLRIENIEAALSPNSIDADLDALCRDIDEVEGMLPPSQEASLNGDVEELSVKEEVVTNTLLDDEGGKEEVPPISSDHGNSRPSSGPYVDVDIDQRPIDVQLDTVVASESSASEDVEENSPPGKRKHSDEERSDGSMRGLSQPSGRLMAPTAASLARGRGGRVRGGRGKPRLGLHAATATSSGIPRKPVGLHAQGSNTSISSQKTANGNAGSVFPPRSTSRLGVQAGGGVQKSRIVGPTTATGRVAEARRRFEPTSGSTSKGTSHSTSQFATPVAAMRPGYASIVQTPATKAANSQNQQQRQLGRQGPKTAQKSSTAAMREAARKAAMSSVRKPAHPSQQQPQQPPSRSGNELLFKSVAQKSSQSSLRSQPSREQQQQRLPTRNPATVDRLQSSLGQQQPADRQARPTPLSIQSNGKRSTSSSRIGATAGAMPIPTSKGKEVAPIDDRYDPSEQPQSESTESGKWGLSNMLSMLSPSSWKSQNNSMVVEGTSSSMPAGDYGMPETPSVTGVREQLGSPYDVHSPQNPYRPRPEHGGNAGQLVMPTYQDMSVPLRRSSGRQSDQSQVSSDRKDSFSSATDSAAVATHPSLREPQHQRLIQMTEDGRVSGVSSFRSSFFSDDEGGTIKSTNAAKRPSLGMARTQSTSDLPKQMQDQGALNTPQPGLRRKGSSRSDEYTSIIPAGSDSPPEVESEYSDEYSDDEFSPAPKRKKNDFTIPRWATTPELLKRLEQQARVNPDRIFGSVKPLRVNEIFNRPESGESRRRPRNSSMIWHGSDALTADDELAYIRKMGFDQ
ncbi:hypothetical protein H4R24_002824 [Coemansia sp. RSA 988]|nr:hypothetical protein H4R24_002824 [Coemansia sp. RSA 988]